MINLRTINTIRERSGGVCEACHTRPSTQVHHRRPKGIGGTTRVYTAEGLEDLCLKCHALRHGMTVVLDDDGDY